LPTCRWPYDSAVAAWLTVGVLGVALLAQSTTQGCDPERSSPTPSTPPSSTVTFTTQDGVRVQADAIVSSLEVPWALAFAPDGRLFVAERPGRVRIVNLSTSTSEIALTLDDVFRQGEAGLLGLALAPDFATTRLVYLYYTAVEGNGAVNRIVRYREAGGRLAERAVLLDNIPAATIHDGGRLRFGPDGLLYATAGDAANGSRAQDAASLAGKFLRIERDGTSARGNPFGSPVFSWGHRNPQGFDWHPATGDIWATEHGNSGNDEVNVIRAGVNYGWPTIEGAQTFPNLEPPLTSFSPAIAPSGAAFYQGTRFSQFVGNLFVATLRGTHLLRLVVDAQGRRVTRQERLLEGTFGRLRDVVVGPDGYIYICTNNRDGRGSPVAADDRIIRLSPGS
jgi:aldose sugar dehydrogenase